MSKVRTTLATFAVTTALGASLVGFSYPATAATPKAKAFVCPASMPEVTQGLTERTSPVPPADTVTHMTICHYAGLNLKGVKFGTMTKQIEVANPALYIKSFAGAKHPQKGYYSCPSDDGGLDLVNLETTSKSVQLRVSMQGCQFVISNYAKGSWFNTVEAARILRHLDTQWRLEMKRAYGSSYPLG